MKKSRKKLLGILLTASIIAATVFPMQGTAAEEIDRGVKSEVQQKEENATQGNMPEPTVSANILPEAELEDFLVAPFSYDINQPVIESFEFEENGQTLTKDGTLHFNMSAYDADDQIKSITLKIYRKSGSSNTQTVTLQNKGGNLYTGTLPCSRFTGYEGEYYIGQIRLEDRRNNYIDWDVQENGKYRYTFTINNNRKVSISDFQIQKNASNADGTLKPGDTVTYTAHVECEGAELRSTYMYMQTVDSSVTRSKSVSMQYNAQTKTLTGTYTIENTTYPSKWKLNYIRTYVASGYQYFYPSNIEPNKDLTYTVVNANYDKQKPVIKSITIDKNGQMVKVGEKVTVKVKVEEENPSSSMTVYFTPQASGIGSNYCSLSLNKNTMEYTGTINITRDTYPTKWELTSISLSDANGNSTSLTDFQADWNTTRPWYYNVDPEGYLDDTKAPVIESITIDKNGEWVYPGDTVTITVKVDEENPSNTGTAYFYPQVSNVSSSHRITLYYNDDTKEYKGTISITDNTYPCEWMLTELYVSDIKGHYTYLNNFKPDWRDTCPWYYRVETDDTYREDVKDATFSIYGLVHQGDGSYQYGYFMENKTVKVGRRDSLKGLGLCPPLPAEGVNMKLLDTVSGREMDGETEIFFGNTTNPSYDFQAVYDKSCVNVVLTYLSKDEGMKMAVVPQFVDKDATYGEMLAAFVAPADADTDLLVEYQLEGEEEAAQVEDTAYVGVVGKYGDCVVAWDVKYLDENGREASKIVFRTYAKGTKVKDALAELEGQPAPEGLEFEQWALPGISGEEILLHEMTNLEVVAVYQGKTTAEVSYTYRGADGRLASGYRLMALDGEDLTYPAAMEKVEGGLKELEHLEGLVLAKWTGVTGGTDIARYKKMNIRAEYANCAVILKYPEGVCEYVVVEKNSDFTLPVENENYMDIVWQGHSMGETVRITEDKEFLVAEAKPKDGDIEEPEQPSDGKLTEEEIDKIITDIEQSGSGGTVHVDMKKVTVVPKEVLEAIKGKEVNIVLDMGAYSWSIGGNEVVASDLKDIDLEVIVDTDDIPPTIVEALAEGKPSTQITLVHNGEFGFRADLTVNLGRENSGCKGNLYYYDSAGKLIFMDAGEIREDGNISLSFSHASEYVVVIDKTLPDSEEEDDSEEDDDSENEDDNENNNDNGNASGSGSSNSGQGNSGQEVISVAKAEDDMLPAAEAEQKNDTDRLKSPKTGE